jgi:hypothetical protein
VIPPITTHAPSKLLAKQWLQAYQFAPAFVAPLILLGTASNGLLSYLTNGVPSYSSVLYATAAVLTASIELQGAGQGTDKDTAKVSWKSWAETVDMKTIAELWAKTNAWRYIITGVATLISATATITMA